MSPAHAMLLFLLALPFPTPSQARQDSARRFTAGDSVQILVQGDPGSGLMLWAAGARRPGRKPAPDFVGWFGRAEVEGWLADARALLAAETPAEDAVETPLLYAADGGFLTLALLGPRGAERWLLTFGHERQRERWFLEAPAADWQRLLSLITETAGAPLGAPDADYANPTAVGTVPDRAPDSPLPGPRVGGPGEVWAAAVLDSRGDVMDGSVRVLWSDAPLLAREVRRLLPAYHYDRRDGGVPSRLRIYQRFRAR